MAYGGRGGAESHTKTTPRVGRHPLPRGTPGGCVSGGPLQNVLLRRLLSWAVPR